MMIVVQEVTRRWTKRERGGKAAVLRNREPEARPLPSLPDVNFSHALIYDDGIREPAVSELVPDRPLEFGCGVVLWESSQVRVDYVYSSYCGGAPIRSLYPRRAFALVPGTWGRMMYNGRFSEEGGWVYQKTVLNIAYVDHLTKKLFLSEPQFVFKEMADLW